MKIFVGVLSQPRATVPVIRVQAAKTEAEVETSILAYINLCFEGEDGYPCKDLDTWLENNDDYDFETGSFDLY